MSTKAMYFMQRDRSPATAGACRRRRHPPRPGQAADRRWKPDSSTVRPHSLAETALPVACTHCRPDPTTRRSGSPAAPAPPAVDTRWRPDPTTPRFGSRAVVPSRLPGSRATGRRLAQTQPSGLSNDERAYPWPKPAPIRGFSNRLDGLGESLGSGGRCGVRYGALRLGLAARAP
jgi:hypothetical protein